MELNEQEAWTVLNALSSLKESHTEQLRDPDYDDPIDRSMIEDDIERIDVLVTRLQEQHDVSYDVMMRVQVDETPDGPVTYFTRDEDFDD